MSDNSIQISGRIQRHTNPFTAQSKLPLLGKLKIGVKVKNAQGKEYPQSIDYFRADGKYAELFHKTFGERPNRVTIAFWSPNPADVCSESYIIRDTAGRLMAEGDGVNWRAWSASSKEYKWGQATLEKMQEQYGEAEASLTLRFILPGIPTVWGIWSLTTKGAASSIPAIRSAFDNVVAFTGGLVQNVPFDLSVEKVKSNKPGESSVFPVLTLVPNVSQDNLDLIARMNEEGRKIRGLLTPEKLKALSTTIDVELVDETKALPPGTPAEEGEAD